MFNFLLFTLPIAIVSVFVILTLIIFWIWALLDCITSKRDTADKLIWILIIVFLNWIGALLYVVFRRKRKIIAVRGKRLYRSRKSRIIAGVCGGLGEYFGIDPVLIRLIWLIFIFVGGGIIAYLIAWIVIPEKR